jgi:hypothetical protein
LDAIKKAASSFAVEPIVVEVHDDADIERAISTQTSDCCPLMSALPPKADISFSCPSPRIIKSVFWLLLFTRVLFAKTS